MRASELAPARLRSIDQELGRAALALDDLADPAARPRLIWHSEQVDLGQLLADSVEAWQVLAAARGVSLRMGGTTTPVLVVGDRLRLAQATGNLLSNAIEHGGGEVEARVRTDGTCVRIEVTDSGPGLSVPVGELTRRARRGRGSRGRGLAIASGIARRHGGRLAAAPSESGARLVLELPRTTDRAKAAR
jgi:signal transduction histidine kinase